MNKVTTINLAGTAYQLEEQGYEKLRAYLNDATAKLGNDPDKDEIIQDLQRAIAEKCDTYLTRSKNVVTTNEVEQIIADMGPVHAAGAEEPSSSRTESTSTESPKRLYRMKESGVLFGVCSGLAAYFNIDVVLVRVIFVILALLTHGAMIGIYIIMALLIPRADTPEKRAAAYGVPFSTQEFIARAHDLRDEMHASTREWKRYRKMWKQQQRAHEMRHTGMWIILGPVLGALSLLWVFALLSLITTHTIFGFMLPVTVPLWLGIVLLCLVYAAVVSPLRYLAFANATGEKTYGHMPGPFGFVFQILFLWFIGWLLYQYVPVAHDFMNTVWMTVQNSGVLK